MQARGVHKKHNPHQNMPTPPAPLTYRGGAMRYSPECVEWAFSEVRKESWNKYCN